MCIGVIVCVHVCGGLLISEQAQWVSWTCICHVTGYHPTFVLKILYHR